MGIVESRARPGVRVEGALGGGPAPLASASLCLRWFPASVFPAWAPSTSAAAGIFHSSQPQLRFAVAAPLIKRAHRLI